MYQVYPHCCRKVLTICAYSNLGLSLLHRASFNRNIIYKKHNLRLPNLINYSHSMATQKVSKAIEISESNFHSDKRAVNRYQGRQLERGHKMDKMSAITRDFYRAKFKFLKQDLSGVTALLNDSKHQGNNTVKSVDFENGYETVINCENDNKNCYKRVKNFRNSCEKMNEIELTALLYYIVRKNKGVPFDSWSQNVKSLFILLDREISRRLNMCYLLDVSETKEMLNFFENVLKIMLENECGLHCFRTYASYCTYRFDSVINDANISLLLLTLFKLYSGPTKIFELIENYMWNNFDSLDSKTVYLFCITFFSCKVQVFSEELLDQIGKNVLHDLISKTERFSCFNLVNVLKMLADSDYSKPSFYHDLASSLATGDFVEKCTTSETMWILHTYASFKLYPVQLVEKLVARFKLLLCNRRKVRSKDIGRFVRLLGMFQYQDDSEQDIFTLCADFMVQELKHLKAKTDSNSQLANGLVDCVDGLIYSGKFHDGVLDALFGMPKLLDLIEETKDEDLLLIYNAVKLEYPDYTGRRIDQGEIDQLQKKIDAKWTIDQELDQSVALQECFGVLTSLLGEDKLRVGYILPHVKTADIEIFLNEKNEPVQHQFATKKAAVEIVGPLQCIKGTDRLVGKFVLKLRQLKLLGYKTVMVYPKGSDDVLMYSSFEVKQQFWIRRLRENGINVELNNKVMQNMAGGHTA